METIFNFLAQRCNFVVYYVFERYSTLVFDIELQSGIVIKLFPFTCYGF